jgi:precorrin-2 dehydrogenase / sirohydrochlorin ferrochelatase
MKVRDVIKLVEPDSASVRMLSERGCAIYYPVMLDVRNKPAIVIGGNRVAAEKAANLSAAGALVTVISQSFCDALLALEREHAVVLQRKAYEHGDLAGAFVVVAATTRNPELTETIWHEAQEHGQLINVADVPQRCNFILPSILRRGHLTISVSTEGTNPGLAKRVRQYLEDLFPSAYAAYFQLAAIARAYGKSYGLSYQQRDTFCDEFFNSGILELLIDGNQVAALETTVALLHKYDIDISVTTLIDDLKEAANSNGNAHDA